MSTWKELILEEMALYGETFEDVVSSTRSDEELDVEADDDLDNKTGGRFTIWSNTRVYFPAGYDGTGWCASVSRNPDGQHTRYVGDGCIAQ